MRLLPRHPKHPFRCRRITLPADRFYGGRSLTGGAGNDLFVFGDARGVFYNDGSARSAGTGDYARITDFQLGDKIQLSDDVGAYFLRSMKIGGFSGVGIYADTDGNRKFGSTDELIGHVVGVRSLSSTDFLFA